MDRIVLKKKIEFAHNNCIFRANNDKALELEEYKDLYNRLASLGEFVLKKFDSMSEDELESFVRLYNVLDLINNILRDKNKRREEARVLDALITQQEAVFKAFYGYSKKEEPDHEKVRSAEESLSTLKDLIQECELDYVMNVNELTKYISKEQLDQIYFETIDYVRELANQLENEVQSGEFDIDTSTKVIEEAITLVYHLKNALYTPNPYSFRLKSVVISNLLRELKGLYQINDKRIGKS